MNRRYKSRIPSSDASRGIFQERALLLRALKADYYFILVYEKINCHLDINNIFLIHTNKRYI